TSPRSNAPAPPPRRGRAPVRKWILGALLVMLAVTIPVTRSVAQAPDAQGWWWQYTEPPLPVDPYGAAPQAPHPPQTPPPPDAPVDGLYIASGASEPEAIAALAWVIPEGASATTLTLIPSAALTPTAVVKVCGTTTQWRPVQ